MTLLAVQTIGTPTGTPTVTIIGTPIGHQTSQKKPKQQQQQQQAAGMQLPRPHAADT
jgi:hypothetical protein